MKNAHVPQSDCRRLLLCLLLPNQWLRTLFPAVQTEQWIKMLWQMCMFSNWILVLLMDFIECWRKFIMHYWIIWQIGVIGESYSSLDGFSFGRNSDGKNIQHIRISWKNYIILCQGHSNFLNWLSPSSIRLLTESRGISYFTLQTASAIWYRLNKYNRPHIQPCW